MILGYVSKDFTIYGIMEKFLDYVDEFTAN